MTENASSAGRAPYRVGSVEITKTTYYLRDECGTRTIDGGFFTAQSPVTGKSFPFGGNGAPTEDEAFWQAVEWAGLHAKDERPKPAGRGFVSVVL